MNASVSDRIQVLAAEDFEVLVEPNVRSKLKKLDSCLRHLLSGASTIQVPDTPGRDLVILPIRDLPPKKGLSTTSGQARMLHDLASIELQAMELGLRTLAEFPEAPRKFSEELAAITADEGRHLELCLNGLDDLGFPWGSFPTHIGLWQAVSEEDSLLDRIVIVHRYLEGSGLDASDTLLRRLSGVASAQSVLKVVQVIRAEEAGHVEFGSRWYHQLARAERLDPEVDFEQRLKSLFCRIPRRLEPISRSTRLSVGFLPGEIEALEKLRELWLNPNEKIHPKSL